MARKINTELWISEIPEEHRIKYDYSKAVYTKSKDKVTIICKTCSTEFSQAAGSHSQGTGCPACGGLRRGADQRLTQEQFIENSKACNGKHFDYCLVKYKNSQTKVDIICPKDGHGVFSMLPLNRTRGQQCPKCAQDVRNAKTTKTQEQFLAQLNNLPNTNTTYENVQYVGDRVKVNFTCNDHGPFLMQPGNFLSGQRCPACSKNGYSHARPGHFYVLSDGATTKVGVTHRNPKKRADEAVRTGGPRMDVVATFFFDDGSIPTKIESACLKYLKARYEPVTQLFDGSTECFYDVDIPALLNFIVPIATPLESA